MTTSKRRAQIKELKARLAAAEDRSGRSARIGCAALAARDLARLAAARPPEPGSGTYAIWQQMELKANLAEAKLDGVTRERDSLRATLNERLDQLDFVPLIEERAKARGRVEMADDVLLWARSIPLAPADLSRLRAVIGFLSGQERIQLNLPPVKDDP